MTACEAVQRRMMVDTRRCLVIVISSCTLALGDIVFTGGFGKIPCLPVDLGICHVYRWILGDISEACC